MFLDCLNKQSFYFNIPGSESQAELLRMLTAAELYINASYYADHPNVTSVQGKANSNHAMFSKNTYFVATLTDDAVKIYENGTKEMAIEKEAEMTCIANNWSALVHLFALANVINRRVLSIYPNVNYALRPLFHGEMVPIVEVDRRSLPIMILWSRDGNLDSTAGYFYEPNHFVLVHYLDPFLEDMEIEPDACCESGTPLKSRDDEKCFENGERQITSKQDTERTKDEEEVMVLITKLNANPEDRTIHNDELMNCESKETMQLKTMDDTNSLDSQKPVDADELRMDNISVGVIPENTKESRQMKSINDAQPHIDAQETITEITKSCDKTGPIIGNDLRSDYASENKRIHVVEDADQEFTKERDMIENDDYITQEDIQYRTKMDTDNLGEIVLANNYMVNQNIPETGEKDCNNAFTPDQLHLESSPGTNSKQEHELPTTLHPCEDPQSVTSAIASAYLVLNEKMDECATTSLNSAFKTNHVQEAETTDDDTPLINFLQADTTDDDTPLSHYINKKMSIPTHESHGQNKTTSLKKPTTCHGSTIQNRTTKNKISGRKRKVVHQAESTDEVETEVDVNETQNESDIEMEQHLDYEEESSDESEEDEPSSVQWTKVSTKMKVNKFRGPTPGSIKENLPDDGEEIDFFYRLFPEAMWKTITDSTNKYVSVYKDYRNKKLLKGEIWEDKTFNEITEDEIKAYVGIRMVMALSNKSAQVDYWSSHSALRNDYIASVMTRGRFFTIQRYFHLADPIKDPTRIADKEARKEAIEKDPLYKVSPLLEHVREQSKRLYNLHAEVSVDEAMIKFHGMHYGSVGAPNKPCKRGFKVFVLADGQTGYLYDFMVYMRKQRETGLTKRVVETLSESITNLNHIIFVDKFYTSIELALSLLKKGTYLNGSFNTSRRNWPHDLKPIKRARKRDDPVRSLQRGDSIARQSKDGKMMAVCWKDSALVYNLSTCHEGVPNKRKDIVERKIRSSSGWNRSQLSCPPSIVEFNKYMGGVDRHDHLRSNYTLQRSTSKWWPYFLWFGFDLALVNGYLLWKERHPKSTHKNFQLKV